MSEKKVLLELRGVKTFFPVRGGFFNKVRDHVQAVNDVDLDIYKGETLGLVGESGCGKTTLGKSIIQLVKATDGTMMYDFGPQHGGKKDLRQLNREDEQVLHRRIQIVFQDPYSSLNPRMTVGQIIGEGMIAHKYFRRNDDRMKEEIVRVMEECGLAPYFLHRYPHQFSGGQRQRIGIARSLALRPKFVVCDEAVSALDVSIQAQIINLLQELKEKQHLTYMFITHDLSVVKYISDRIGVMYLGSMVELAPSDDIFQHPLHPYTEALLNAIPTTDEDAAKKPEVLEGDIPSPVNPPKGCKFHTRCKYCTEICTHVVPEMREIRPNHFVACHHILEKGSSEG